MQSIDHIVLIVTDLTKTADFYRTFLGEPEQQDDEQVAFKIGETKLFFGLPYNAATTYDKDSCGLNHVAFWVGDSRELKELGRKLDAADIVHSGVKIDPYGDKEFIWFDDPDGYRLEFYLR